MKEMKRHLAAALIAFGIAAPIIPAASARAQDAPAFEPADCAAMLKSPVESPLDLIFPTPPEPGFKCGYVSVPEVHDNPNGKSLQIAVVVIPAVQQNARQEDPLFLAQGGPGGSTIDAYKISMRGNLIRETRDIVLFDQRGTRNSQPALLCPESYDLTVRTAEQNLSYDEGTRLGLEAVAACRQRLVDEGVNLDAFDSVENARDINIIRQALGYDTINLYGVSYGTLLALHALRENPDILRSVIIDAVVPTQLNFIPEAYRSQNRAFTELITACNADLTCKTAYPDLEKVLFEQVDRLNQNPVRVRVTDQNTRISYLGYLDGDALQSIIFQGLYSTEIIPLLPMMVYEMRDGRTAMLGNITSLFAFDKSIASGMYYSVLCAEDNDYDPQSALSPDLRSQVAENAVRDLTAQQRICQSWAVEQLPSAVDEPVASDKPVLVLNGRFDPITPPANGALAAETLPNAGVLTFPNTAHGAFPGDECATAVVQAFLDDPTAPVVGRCIEDAKPITFVDRADVVQLPWLGELLTTAPNDRLLPLGVLSMASLSITLGLILIPLSFLGRTLFNKHHPTLSPPGLATLMPWALLFLSVVVSVYFFTALGLAIQSIVQGSYLFLIGVQGQRWLTWLPYVAAFLTLLVVVGTVAGWTSPAWGMLRKVHRGGLALAAMATVMAMFAITI
jgi:pimeloyl-ACP methyl ester carboxylesterase